MGYSSTVQATNCTDGAFESDGSNRAVGAGAVVIDAFQHLLWTLGKTVAEISFSEALVNL